MPDPVTTPPAPAAAPPAPGTTSPPAPTPAPAAPGGPATPPAPPPAPPPAGEPPPSGSGGAAPRVPDVNPVPPAKPDIAPPAAPMDIKIPEGGKFDEKVLNQAKAIMADPKTTPQQKLQSIVELQHEFQTAAEKSIVEQMQRNRANDLEALKGDPKFGGAMFDRTVAASRALLEKSQHGAAVSRKLVAYGLDYDPDFTKLFAEFSGLIAEDATGQRLNNAPPVPTVRPKTQTERMAARYAKKPTQPNNAPRK